MGGGHIHTGGEHSHGWELVGILVMIAGAMLVVRVLAPVADAAGAAFGELVHIVIVTAGCLLIAAVLGGAGLWFWRKRHPRPARQAIAPWRAQVTGRAQVPAAPPVARPAARALPAPAPAVTEVHNHWHLPEGMDPDVLAAAIARAQNTRS